MSYKVIDYNKDDNQITQDINYNIKLFSEINPYPSYDLMYNQNTLQKRIFKDFCYELHNEYSITNHRLCKIMYDNITNKEIVKRCGFKIFEKGGMQALRSIYYVMTLITPFENSEDTEIRYYPLQISSFWDGIGGWKH